MTTFAFLLILGSLAINFKTCVLRALFTSRPGICLSTARYCEIFRGEEHLSGSSNGCQDQGTYIHAGISDSTTAITYPPSPHRNK
ncbi:hypothetical protein VUR80DRAFT_3771 [Thermomyces stellatus]